MRNAVGQPETLRVVGEHNPCGVTHGHSVTLSVHTCPDMDALVLTAASELNVPASCCTFGVAISLDVVQRWRSIIVEGVDRTVGLRERFYFVSRAAHSSFLLSICL